MVAAFASIWPLSASPDPGSNLLSSSALCDSQSYWLAGISESGSSTRSSTGRFAGRLNSGANVSRENSPPRPANIHTFFDFAKSAERAS